MPLCLLLWAIANSVAAQQSSPDDAKVLLFEVRKNMMKTIDRLPKYLCTETVDRSTFQPEAETKNRSCDGWRAAEIARTGESA
jgi:hypothetical protein